MSKRLRVLRKREKQTPHWAQSLMRGSIRGWRQTLNWLSHPGAPGTGLSSSFWRSPIVWIHYISIPLPPDYKLLQGWIVFFSDFWPFTVPGIQEAPLMEYTLHVKSFASLYLIWPSLQAYRLKQIFPFYVCTYVCMYVCMYVISMPNVGLEPMAPRLSHVPYWLSQPGAPVSPFIDEETKALSLA